MTQPKPTPKSAAKPKKTPARKRAPKAQAPKVGVERPVTATAVTDAHTLDIGSEQALILPARTGNLIGGMPVPRLLSTKGIDPYAAVKWERRDVVIMDWKTGKPSYERRGVEVPAHWAQNAVNITVSKYLFGRDEGTPEYEDSLKHAFDRIANTYTVWGWKHGYFASEEDALSYNQEMKTMLVEQRWAPNSPVWFNIGHWEQWRWGRPDLRAAFSGRGNKAFKANMPDGWEPTEGESAEDILAAMKVKTAVSNLEHPQASACFLLGVKDSMEGILEHQIAEGGVFSSGSGVGINISSMRSSAEPIKGKGMASGPISFDKGWDRMAGAIKSGGKTRRAARMVLMYGDHPDIFKFLEVKNQQEDIGKIILREHNVHMALIPVAKEKQVTGTPAERMVADIVLSLPVVNDVTYSSGMDDLLYGETLGHQNANHSVSLKGDFWQAYYAGSKYSTRWVTDPKHIHETFSPDKLLTLMAENVWENAEPGVHNNDFINLWNPAKEDGEVSTSNPCITGDSLIASSLGLLPIEDQVGTNHQVVGRDGELYPTTRIIETGTKPVYKLTTKAGYSLKLTADHLVDTLNRGDTPAIDLTKDDTIKLCGSPFGAISLQPEFAYILGCALGNGCIAKGDQRTLSLTFTKDQTELANKVCADLNNLKLNVFGEHITDKRKLHPSTVQETDTTLKITTSQLEFIAEIEKYVELDGNAPHKRLTLAGFQLDEVSTRNMLTGLFDADGTVANYTDKSQYISLDLTSKGLLKQTQLILLSFGIKSKLYIDRRVVGETTAMLPDGKGGTKEYPVEQMHSLRISRSSRVVFEERVGFNHLAKRATLRTINATVSTYSDRMEDKVDTLEYLGEEKVYDLTEPVTDHFVANGIVIHNCSEYLHHNNTSCNLSSFNVYRFFDAVTQTLKVEELQHCIRLAMFAADLNVEEGGFPIPEIARGTYLYRTTGIGYANLGGLLMAMGMPYDSDQGRHIVSQLISLLTSTCWQVSAEMGTQLGSFPRFEGNKESLFEVLRLHKAVQELSSRIAAASINGSLTRAQAETIADNVFADHVKDGLPEAQGLTGLDALKGYLNSFADFHLEAHPIMGQLSDVNSATWTNLLNAKSLRNSFVTCIAPTGTISAPMGIYDEGTTSAEPDYTLVKMKNLSGGGTIKMFNTLALKGLISQGYSEYQAHEAAFEVAGIDGLFLACHGSTEAMAKHLVQELRPAEQGIIRQTFLQLIGDKSRDLSAVESLIVELRTKSANFTAAGAEKVVIDGSSHMEGIPWIREEHLAAFDCSATAGTGNRSILAKGHMQMLGVIQPFTSGAVSKTVNLPATATVDEIKNCFIDCHGMGVKCVALFRSDSKGISVYDSSTPEGQKWDPTNIWNRLVESTRERTEALVKDASKPRRIKLPGRRISQTVKFSIAGQLDGFLTVGVYPDGTCGEVFGRVGQGGSFVSGMFDAFCKSFSISLQYGVPLKDVIESFRYMAFDPAGFTKVGDTDGATEEIRNCKSVVDLMMQILGWLFPDSRLRDMTFVESGDVELPTKNGPAQITAEPPVTTPAPKVSETSKNKSAQACPKCSSLAYVHDGKCRSCRECGFKDGGCGE